MVYEEIRAEAVRGSCRNMVFGCNESVDYAYRNDHEEACIYAPCACPIHNCDFFGSSDQLSLHFSNKHWDSGRRFQYDCPLRVSLGKNDSYLVLQAEKDGMLFLLNKGTESIGLTLMITCIAPSSFKEQFFYDLVSERGSSSLRLKSYTNNYPGRIEGFPLMDFLVIPFTYLSSSGELDLEICIWNSNEPILA